MNGAGSEPIAIPTACLTLHKKMKFSIKDFFPQFPADLVVFTEEILNGKLHLLCSLMVEFQTIKQQLSKK